MDRVLIRGLRLDTVIGVLEWERKVRQTLLLDLDMAWDNRPAAASRQLADALDYAAVSQRLLEVGQACEHLLIETLAEELAGLVREEFGVPWLRLQVTKPGAVMEANSVAVVIERGAESP